MQLSTDQQSVVDAMKQLLVDPDEQCLVISGAAGTGKTFCLQQYKADFPAFMASIRSLNKDISYYSLTFTATTNKAVEALSSSIGEEATTIHSLLKLRLIRNSQGKQVLVSADKNHMVKNAVIVIDECSYLDEELMGFLQKHTENCKYIFIGDAQQLTPVGLDHAPVFHYGFNTVELNQIMRQANGNPIQQLSKDLRAYVAGAAFPSIVPDGVNIVHMSEEDMFAEMLADFSRPDFTYYQAKFIAWTNKKVNDNNKALSDAIRSTPHFLPGDYAACNTYFSNGNLVIKTDQLVKIYAVNPNLVLHGIKGSEIVLATGHTVFLPDNIKKATAFIEKMWADEERKLARELEKQVIDLRPIYSCTVHKSQGSTFDTVYLDLDNILICKDPDELARLIYVAISRARNKLVITGTIP